MTSTLDTEHRTIAALAVIVEDETIGKKRMIHDATHAVRVNHQIRCRDKMRAPGAREKKQLVREMMQAKQVAFSVVGDISKGPPPLQAPGGGAWLAWLPDRC